MHFVMSQLTKTPCQSYFRRSTQFIGKVHQPIHTFFSNARRITEGIPLVWFDQDIEASALPRRLQIAASQKVCAQDI